MENICVHGDSFHNNTIALVVPTKSNLRELAKLRNKDSLTFQEMCADEDITDEIKKALTNHAIKSGLLKIEIPTKVKLCSEEWVPDSGLVTAALKIRRKQLLDFFQSDIKRLYCDVTSTKST